MKRLTAQDFDQELLILFDAYVHGTIDRRGFLAGAQKFAVGGMSAGMLLAALSPNFAQAQQLKPDDQRLRSGRRALHGACVCGHPARFQQRHHTAL
jgi:carboxymethylenebutenolidase